jgi:hypothetical protein
MHKVTPFFDFLDPASRRAAMMSTFPVKRMVFKLPNDLTRRGY